jgi:hypothetical protein
MNKQELLKLREKYSLKNFLTDEEYEKARLKYTNVKVKPLIDIEDIKLSPKETYNRIKYLKKSNVQVEYTEDMINEYRRCLRDPIYFINAYVKIIHVDFGKVSFNLRPFQEDIVQICNEFNKVVINSSRQVGKCVSSSNNINILVPIKFKYNILNVITKHLYKTLIRIKLWGIEIQFNNDKY